MVLRGSVTKPDVGVKEVLRKSSDAIIERKAKEAAFHIESEALWTRLEKTAENQQELTQAELYSLIHRLHSRIQLLEDERIAAEKYAEEQYADVTRVFKQLLCGGLAGCVARSCVAPIDRTKILLQTQALTFANEGKVSGPKYRGIFHTWRVIIKEEGFKKLWRGNGVNCIRVAPYAATQFASYDFYKSLISSNENLTIPKRLLCGALAGATATTITHPLDVIRLRLAVCFILFQIRIFFSLDGFQDALRHVVKENGFRSLYKGYVPTLLSLSPFIAINFSAFDIFKRIAYPEGPSGGWSAHVRLVAQSCCYPLDTVRRRMQLPGTHYKSVCDAFATIPKKEGIRGLYKGMLPNAVKIVPNNGIRFLAYQFFKDIFGAEKKKYEK
eukprot:GSMAST32.ASY1.ANO1.128.1 assembled CDS